MRNQQAQRLKSHRKQESTSFLIVCEFEMRIPRIKFILLPTQTRSSTYSHEKTQSPSSLKNITQEYYSAGNSNFKIHLIPLIWTSDIWFFWLYRPFLAGPERNGLSHNKIFWLYGLDFGYMDFFEAIESFKMSLSGRAVSLKSGLSFYSKFRRNSRVMSHSSKYSTYRL